MAHAEDQLSHAADARAALLGATNRSRAHHLCIALLLGIAVACVTYGWDRTAIHWVVAGLALAVLVVVAVYDIRGRRRRGRIMDDRAAKSNFGRYVVAYLPVVVVSIFRPQPPVPAGWAAAAGASIAIFTYVYLRWDQSYQSRRLRSGDFGPHDLV